MLNAHTCDTQSAAHATDQTQGREGGILKSHDTALVQRSAGRTFGRSWPETYLAGALYRSYTNPPMTPQVGPWEIVKNSCEVCDS